MDMQYCVSRHKVIEYCAKYATEREPRSETMKEIFSKIVRSLKDDNTSLKAVQKLLINSIGDRDYSAQETCHLLLQLLMFKAFRDFIVLSLDESRAVEEQLDDGQPATALSILDHYIARPATLWFRDMKLLHFVQQHTMPKELSSDPSRRRKDVVVIVRPYLSPEPNGPNYEQYCRQKLMLNVPFHREEELQGEADTYADAYATFLQSDNLPPSLEDDIHRLEQQNQHSLVNDSAEVCWKPCTSHNYMVATLFVFKSDVNKLRLNT